MNICEASYQLEHDYYQKIAGYPAQISCKLLLLNCPTERCNCFTLNWTGNFVSRPLINSLRKQGQTVHKQR